MRTVDTTEQQKVQAALNRAVEALETSMRDQEQAALLIVGLAERILEKTADKPTQIQLEGIMEACTFQDITGQRIQKVVRLIKYLRDNAIVEAGDLPMSEPKKTGLTQEEVNRLLTGGKPITK